MVETKPYMIADFMRVLEKDGREMVVDGATIRGFVTPVTTSPGEFERSLTVQQKIFFLDGDLEEKVAGQIVTIDSVRWMVVAATVAGVTACLLLERSMG